MHAAPTKLADMEPMRITILTVRKRDGMFVARAVAVAAAARIHLEVKFLPRAGSTAADQWNRARDEVLRYLDPA